MASNLKLQGARSLYPSVRSLALPAYNSYSPAGPGSPSADLHQPAVYYVQTPSEIDRNSDKRFVASHPNPCPSPIHRGFTYQATMEKPSAVPYGDSDSDSDIETSSTYESKRSSGPWSSGRPDRMDEESAFLLPRSGHVTDNYEPELEDFRTLCKRVIYLITVLTTILLGSATVLYWIVCQPQAPIAAVESIDFKQFQLSPGFDRTGVPTQVITVDSIANITFYNPSKFYAAAVKDFSGSLSYIRNIASGKAGGFFQPEESANIISLRLSSSLVPLYGAATGMLSAMDQGKNINIVLHFQITSEFFMFRGMVHTQYIQSMKCDILLNPIVGVAVETSCFPVHV